MATDDRSSVQEEPVPPSYDERLPDAQPEEKSAAEDNGRLNTRRSVLLSSKVSNASAIYRPSLSSRGPILVLTVAYGVVAIWNLLTDFSYLHDSNPLVMASIVTTLLFDGSTVLFTGFGFWAFAKSRITAMGIYVYALLALLLLSVTNVVLSIASPIPKDLESVLNEVAAENPNVDRNSLANKMKLQQSLYMAAALIFHILYFLVLRKYYLNVKKESSSKSSVEPAPDGPPADLSQNV